MTLKNTITTLKNLIKMREMTLNDPKFDIKKSLDTMKGVGIYMYDVTILTKTRNDLKLPQTT